MDPNNYTTNQLKSLWKKIIDRKDQYSEIFDIIKNDIDKINKEQIDKDAKEEMLSFAEEYGGCENFKSKVDNEGLDYFYNNYASLRAPFEIFSDYVETGDCWCGICAEKEMEEVQEEIIEDLHNIIDCTAYTCKHLKKIYSNEVKLISLFKNELKYTDSTKFRILKRLIRQEDCFCEKCDKKDEDTPDLLEELFLQDEFQTCEWLKDKVKNIGTDKFYYANNKLVKQVPFDRFLRFIHSGKCWCSDGCKYDEDCIEDLNKFFKCNGGQELAEKLKGETLYSDKFYNKYFNGYRKCLGFNYGQLKTYLEISSLE